MGERCYVIVRCPEDQADGLCEILGDEPEVRNSFGDGWVEMGFDQCNWAVEEEREEAACRGLVFFGFHGSVQGAYPGTIFASNGDGELYQAIHLDDDTLAPVVHLTEDGVDPEELAHAQKVFEIYRALKARAMEREGDFGEMLEANLRCSSNEKVIEQMALHDIENVGLVLDYVRFLMDGKTVYCKFCHGAVSAAGAHRHDGGYVGECCWDERLRTTE